MYYCFSENSRFVLMGDIAVKKRSGWIRTGLCCVLLLAVLTQLALAAGDKTIEERLQTAKNAAHNYVTYDLDELGMSIDIFREYTVFTRDTPADDPNYELYGLSKADMDSVMESNNIYLDALSPDDDIEITITKIDGFPEEYSFDVLSDEEVSDVLEGIKSSYEAAGLTIYGSEVYSHAQLKFIKMCVLVEVDGQKVYEIQYYTVYDTKAISIQLRTFTEISSATEKAFQLLIDGADFWNAKTDSKGSASTPSFLYTDTESGMSFTVPENWIQVPMNEPRQFLDAKFVPNSDDGVGIIFACEDIYGTEEIQNSLTPGEKKLLSRIDLTDLVLMSKSDAAEMLGVEESDVTTKSYGSKDHFYASAMIPATVNGMEVSVPMTYAIRVENGYLYMFQFCGPADGPYMEDFETLMNSVKYPESASEGADSSAVSSPGNTALTVMTLIIADLIGTIFIYTFPIMIYRYGIVKKPLNRKKAKRIVIIYGICAFFVMTLLIVAINGSGAAGSAILLWSWVNYGILTRGKDRSGDAVEPCLEEIGSGAEDTMSSPSETMETTTTDATTTDATDTDLLPENVFCSRCGTQLPRESKFCHKCGEKMKGEDVRNERLL